MTSYRCQMDHATGALTCQPGDPCALCPLAGHTNRGWTGKKCPQCAGADGSACSAAGVFEMIRTELAALGLVCLSKREQEELAVALYKFANKPDGNAYWATLIQLKKSGEALVECVEFIKLQQGLVMSGAIKPEQVAVAMQNFSAEREARPR